MTINKNHFNNLLGYIAIGLIAGSISHGFFTAARSLITAGIGILLFIIHEGLKDKEKERNYLLMSITALFYALAVGMVSGGIQHFLDSPTRSLWIIPVGFIVSLIMYPFKDGIVEKINRYKSLFFGVVFSIILYLLLWFALHIIPANMFYGDHHALQGTAIVSHIYSSLLTS